MKRRFVAALAGMTLALSATAANADAAPATSVTTRGAATAEPRRAVPSAYDADACVALALRQNALIDEAEAKVAEWRAKLAQVESIYYPKIQGQALLSPMYTIEGSALDASVDKQWRSIRDWGPYSQLELTLIQPIYTFGRADAGGDAAAARAAVEQARVRRVENQVALEVRKYYFSYLFARSVQPTLDWANEQVHKAMTQAREWHEAGTGKVSTVDLAKLEFADAELDQLRGLADSGAELALSALKFTMGLGDAAALPLAHDRLPRPWDVTVPTLAEMLLTASQARPEWDEIREGRRAALRLADAELLANAPTLFFAGRVSHRWAPTVDNQTNPFHRDRFNGSGGGVALGLRFDLDPRKTVTKARKARAQAAQVDALDRFAQSGIPLEVRRAHTEFATAMANFEHASRGRRAARKWAFFSSSAFLTGAGSAKDVIEGIVAYLEATRTFYKSLLEIYLTKAELDFAVGLPQSGAVE